MNNLSIIGYLGYSSIYVNIVMVKNANTLKKAIKDKQNPQKAVILQSFFKTGKGQYAEGDIFYGLTVPESRILARQFQDIAFEEIPKLLHSKIHEERLIALFLLIEKFQKGDEKQKKKVVDFYLASTAWINNWDLVDTSAYKILGEYLLDKETKILTRLVLSKDLWEKRIAIVATFAFIRKGRLDETFRFAKILMHDSHDLIHKAMGWMLREAGKRDRIPLEVFLEEYASVMPRTMLRYAIEKFSPVEKNYYLKKK